MGMRRYDSDRKLEIHNLMNTLNYTAKQNSSKRPGYEYLSAYCLGVVIQELTEQFTYRWIKSFRRREQMDEAARSNPQCVSEGYSQESLKSYIKLAGVARGSNEELGNDYLNFLKKEGLSIWDINHPKIREFRQFRAVWVSPKTLNTPQLPKNPEEAANMLYTFCQMDGYLLIKLIESLKQKHMRQGGLTEELYRRRSEYRDKNKYGQGK